MVIVDNGNGNGNGREWEQRCWVDKLYLQSQSSDDDDKLSATPTNYELYPQSQSSDSDAIYLGLLGQTVTGRPADCRLRDDETTGPTRP